jgi:hypothetical protein
VAVPLLVRLAAADGDAKALGRFLEVLDIERDELGATEGAGKAEQQQRPVANGRKPRIPASGAIPITRSAVAGAFLQGAAPRERRIPRTVARTRSSSVGSGKPASLWA